jgi:hypothetical protein
MGEKIILYNQSKKSFFLPKEIYERKEKINIRGNATGLMSNGYIPFSSLE